MQNELGVWGPLEPECPLVSLVKQAFTAVIIPSKVSLFLTFSSTQASCFQRDLLAHLEFEVNV